MARVMIIPGLTVRRYLQPSADALRAAGHSVVLYQPLGWPKTGTDLGRYGGRLAEATRKTGPVDLMIGCSVGTQGAVAAALAGADVSRLLLVSPTIEPGRRTIRASLRGWLGGEDHRDSPGWPVHVPDWLTGGLTGIYRGLQSAIGFRLENELPRLQLPVTLVHGDADQLSPLPFAADLADRCGGSLLIMPDAPHSWPVGDQVRLVDLVAALTADPARE